MEKLIMWDANMREERTDKYEIIEGDTLDIGDLSAGRVVYRIRALKDFRDVKAGDLGGFIECKDNLSQRFNSWVYPGSVVCGDARVRDDGKVRGNSRLQGSSIVGSRAEVSDVTLRDNVTIEGNAQVANVALSGNLYVSGEADIQLARDVVFYSRVGSECGVLTAYRTRDNSVGVTRGCFTGSLGEFETAVAKTHGKVGTFRANEYALEYEALVKAIKVHFNVKTVSSPGLGKIYLCVDK